MVTQRLLTSAGRFSHLSVPLAAVVILLVLLVPLPAFALDVLISFNLMLSVVVLLSSIYILQPVKFNFFSQPPAAHIPVPLKCFAAERPKHKAQGGARLCERKPWVCD